MTEEKLYSAFRVNSTTIEFTSGQQLSRVHKEENCGPRNCPFHNPSDHLYRDLPLFFNGLNMIRLTTDLENHPTGTIIDPDDYIFNISGYAILKNSGKCTLCDEELISQWRSDPQTCSCGNVTVDGGPWRFSLDVKNLENFLDTSVMVKKKTSKDD
jgi:hypothetical protein